MNIKIIYSLLFFVALLIMRCSAPALSITPAGFNIDGRAELQYGYSLVTSEVSSTMVRQMYGITLEPNSQSAGDTPGVTHYFAYKFSNLGNGTDNIRFYIKTSTPETWTFNFILDDNNNATHESWETTILPNPLPIAEESIVNYFVAIKSPSTEPDGITGMVNYLITGESFDGGYYIGANGTIYGGPDTIEATDILTAEALGHLVIHRRDADKKIYLTWNGGAADVYSLSAFNASFEGAVVEAYNVTSPYYCSIEAQDGRTRFYRIALAGTLSFARQTVGKYDSPLTVGINQLSSPLVLYSNEIKDIIGTQVTGSNLSAMADRAWRYSSSNPSEFDVAWLVGGVNSTYDGKWYTGNAETTVKIGTDEGFYLQIRSGHPATYLTMIGEVANSDRVVPINIGMNMVGYCFPVARNLRQSNLYESNMAGSNNAATADRVWTYNASLPSEFDVAWLVGGAVINGYNPSLSGSWYTGSAPTTLAMQPGKGYWIQVRPYHSAFTWTCKWDAVPGY